MSEKSPLDAGDQATLAELRAQLAAQVRKCRRLTVALGVAFLALVVVGLLLQQQYAKEARRQAETNRAVEQALHEAEELLKESRWDKARRVLEQSKARLGEDGDEQLRQQLHQALTDVELVGELEAIRSDDSR